MSPSLQLVAASCLLFLSLPLLPRAAEYTVGDGPWDTGTNYAAWADNHAFVAGDVLVFQYVKSQHNVFEVTEGTYRSCDTSAGVLKGYTTGFDRIELTEARSYWFICDYPGHCVGGMKLAVNVSAGSAGRGDAGPPPSVPLPPSGSAAVPSPAGGCRSWAAWALTLSVFVVVNYI
ncbi:hypothetical protein ABZP36_011378 [Zizania latifolia]